MKSFVFENPTVPEYCQHEYWLLLCNTINKNLGWFCFDPRMYTIFSFENKSLLSTCFYDNLPLVLRLKLQGTAKRRKKEPVLIVETSRNDLINTRFTWCVFTAPNNFCSLCTPSLHVTIYRKERWASNLLFLCHHLIV